MTDMTILVYPVGPARGELLRYSLRSVAANIDGRALPRIVVIGELPDYIDPGTVEYLPGVGGRGPFAAVWAAWRAAARHLDGAGTWWWWNDDFFLTGPAATGLIQAHRGSLDQFIKRLEGRGNYAAWRVRAARSAYVLDAEGICDPLCWEAHRPLRTTSADVDAAAEALARHRLDGARVAVRTLIGGLAAYTGADLPDPKTESANGVFHYPIMSTGPRAWSGHVGEQLRGRYDTPSPWERH